MVQSLFLPGLCGDTVGRCSQCEARVQSDQVGYGQVISLARRALRMTQRGRSRLRVKNGFWCIPGYVVANDYWRHIHDGDYFFGLVRIVTASLV